MYLKKAGTTILVISVIVWFCSNYPANHQLTKTYELQIAQLNHNLQLAPEQKIREQQQLQNELSSAQLSHSIAGKIGHTIEPLLKPLGFNWQLGIALVTGLAAKEVIVSTLGTIYSVGDVANDATPLQEIMRKDSNITPLIALSFLIFTLFYTPCIAASTVFHKEVGKLKWTVFYLFFTTGTAYVLTFLVYQGGKLLGHTLTKMAFG